MKKLIYIFLIISFSHRISFAEMLVKIVDVSGDAKVRYGLDEKWESAKIGLELKEIDTILTGENGEIILQLAGGKKFILGGSSILDISDLRVIQEKELFLYLMAKKVDKIEPRTEKTKLRLGNVSSLHGNYKGSTDSTNSENDEVSTAEKEINGSLALYLQKYYTNTVYKLYNLLDKYKSKIQMGKVYFYIAKAFQALDKNGQAIDAYQSVIAFYDNKNNLSKEDSSYISDSKKAIDKLKM